MDRLRGTSERFASIFMAVNILVVKKALRDAACFVVRLLSVGHCIIYQRKVNASN